MSSLGSSQRSELGSTSFSLAKFSYATVSGELVKPIPWTHVSDRGQLFAIFANTRIPNNDAVNVQKSTLKVVAQPEVLEDLNLCTLGREALRAAHDMKTKPSPQRFPAVTIIVQEPCIAARFPLQYGQIRRFQMRFKLASDFYTALALLSQAGCPFIHAGSQPPQAQTIHSPATTSAVAPAVTIPHPREVLSSASSTANSSQRAAGTDIGAAIHLSSRPSTSSSSPAKSIPRTSCCSNTVYDTNKSMANSGNSQLYPFLPLQNLVPGTSDSVSDRDWKLGTTNPEFPMNLPILPSSDPLGASKGPRLSNTVNDTGPGCLSTAIRPSTAPSYGSPNLAHMLPPKRELPFKRPRTASERVKIVPTSSRLPSKRVENSPQDSGWENAASPNAESNQQQDEEPGKQPRRVAAKRVTRASQGIRTSTAASRPVKKPCVLHNNTPVPGVEELLSGAQDMKDAQGKVSSANHGPEGSIAARFGSPIPSLKDNCQTGGPNKTSPANGGGAGTTNETLSTSQSHNIDTQELLARVEERQRRKLIKGKDVTNDSEDVFLAAAMHWDAFEAGPEVPAPSPCSDRVQTTAVSSTPHTSHEHIAAKPTETDEADAIERRSQPLADITNVVQSSRSEGIANSAARALMNDPDFVKSPEIANGQICQPKNEMRHLRHGCVSS